MIGLLTKTRKIYYNSVFKQTKYAKNRHSRAGAGIAPQIGKI